MTSSRHSRATRAAFDHTDPDALTELANRVTDVGSELESFSMGLEMHDGEHLVSI